jgi:DNA polymerase-3 subunit delta
MIVTLTGPNDHARKQELGSLLATFVAEHGDMAVERLDGEETSAERMHEALASLPFLTARKLVILREAGKQKAFSEHISEVLGNVAETTDVIIYEPKLDKRGVYYKTLKKETDFKEFGDMDAVGLARWAGNYAKEQGGQLAAADARLLIDRVGLNQQVLQHELDKLLVFDPAITRRTIELLTERTPASTIFELLDAAFGGKTKYAFELYREQRALKVEPQAIIAMLAWQLHVLAVVKAGGNRVPDAIAKEAKLNPFVVRKSLGLARRLTLEHIKRLVADLLQLDRQLKRSNLDADEALQLYLLKMNGADTLAS